MREKLETDRLKHYGPRTDENFSLFSYLSDSMNQTIIGKV